MDENGNEVKVSSFADDDSSVDSASVKNEMVNDSEGLTIKDSLDEEEDVPEAVIGLGEDE